jgi:hypothetical protein
MQKRKHVDPKRVEEIRKEIDFSAFRVYDIGICEMSFWGRHTRVILYCSKLRRMPGVVCVEPILSGST